LSGANLIHDVGYIDHGTNASLESLVLNDEMMGMVRQFGKGINTDDEHLALDLIEKQGPAGEYVTTDHTFDYWKEWFLPNLQDRTDYETWQKAGSKTMDQRVKEKTDELLSSYEAEAIDKNMKKELHAIIDAADKRHS
ncbi:MAG: trimethylamine methyltransferase, partial [Bacteroidetes bacterium]|nr:trimethylamine methyltransferase [Bacteroidota bacterium]